MNPNSTLTYTEFSNIKGQLTAKEEMEDRIKELEFWYVENWRTEVFDKLDLDGDNRVDFHEFYAATIDHK